MTAYWFRPKRFGYGSTPCTWQGWAFVGVFVLGLVACSELTRRSLSLRPLRIENLGQFCVSLLAALVLIGACSYVIARKTEGGLRWRGWR
jgi:hypothetical protein